MLDYLSSIGKTSRDEIFQGFWRPNFLGQCHDFVNSSPTFFRHNFVGQTPKETYLKKWKKKIHFSALQQSNQESIWVQIIS